MKKIINNTNISRKIFTIPNILSFFRILLIPLIVWLYIVKKEYGWTALIIIISGITDILDGIIARKFNMVSDFGKIIDPIADKLTQLAVLFSLVFRFRLMLLPLVIMVIKEIISILLRIIIYFKTKQVDSALWHGKLNTVVLYFIMIVHIVWYNIPSTFSIITIILSSIIMVISCVLYTISNAIIISKNKQ